MKFDLCILLNVVGLISSFHVSPGYWTKRKVSSSLEMGFFDFKPIHGMGSGLKDEDLDEQFKLQQEIVSHFSIK